MNSQAPAASLPLLSKVANATLRLDGLGDFSRVRDGMVWVGGRVELGTERLMFHANRANRLITPAVLGPQHPMTMDFGLSLDAEFEIIVHNRIGASTIELVLADDSQIGIRCWRAAAFAEQIAARRHPGPN
ncbi:hypothetical protein ACI1US_02306 [Leucobacter sp. BZR 635]